MKKYILPLMSIALLMAMASCSSSDDEVAENNNAEGKLVPMTFTATQENNVGTRTVLNDKKVVWKTTDEISVFDGTTAENNQRFKLKDGDATSGVFIGTASSTATEFTAVYPYTSGAQLESDGIVSGITLPAEQTATPNSFDPKAALMMAYTTNKSQLNFKNAVSLVKITTDFYCKKIVLSANEDIAGTGKLTMTFDDANNTYTSSFSFTSGNSKTITLKPATGEETIATGTYYIVVPPTTLSGFSISFTASADDKVYTRKSTKSNTFNRSKIKDFGSFATNGDYWYDEQRGIVKKSQEVDLGLEVIIGSKKYKVIFAKSNLTATGLAEHEYDYGDYFAWGATSILYSAINKGTSTWTITPIDGKSGGYVKTNAPYYNGSSYTKYTTSGETLKAEDDAAKVILGGDWQIPTTEIWKALCDAYENSVYWGPNDGGMTFEKINNIDGMKITKKDASSTYLFLPAAGYVSMTSFFGVGNNVYYWSGTASSDTAYSGTAAYILRFRAIVDGQKRTDVEAQYGFMRYYGVSVRPVRLVAVN